MHDKEAYRKEFWVVKPCVSSERSLLRSLDFLLHPGEDLEDGLVEVFGLVGEDVMTRSSDHLINTKVENQLFGDDAVVGHNRR